MLDKDNKIVALHFAGSELVSVACKIGNVIEALGIEIVTGQIPPPSRCFIATAAFGSDLEPHVQFLREFRDDIVKSRMRTGFEHLLRLYYRFSPPLAFKMQKHRAVKETIKYSVVYPFVGCARVIVLLLEILGVRKDKNDRHA